MVYDSNEIGVKGFEKPVLGSLGQAVALTDIYKPLTLHWLVTKILPAAKK